MLGSLMFLGDDKLVKVFLFLVFIFIHFRQPYLATLPTQVSASSLRMPSSRSRSRSKSFMSVLCSIKKRELTYKFYFKTHYLLKIEIYLFWRSCVHWNVVLLFLIWIWQAIQLKIFKLCRQYINMTLHFCWLTGIVKENVTRHLISSSFSITYCHKIYCQLNI